MTSKELTDQGITALKEGDKDRARDYLEQAVDLDPNNAKAWYFLSRAQTTVAEKRVSLNTVLAIMPDNRLAKEALENLPPEDGYEEMVAPVEDVATSSTSSVADGEPMGLPASLPSMGLGHGTKPKINGFELPVAIPDAPESVDTRTLYEQFVATFKTGVEILRRTPGVYNAEVQRANWWRFWQFAIVAWLIGAVASTLAGFIFQTQLAETLNNSPFATDVVVSPNILSIILSLVVFIPVNVVVLYMGLYASHRFITTNRNGQASFITHAYTILLPVVTAGLISDVVDLVFSLAPLMGSLISIALFALWIYSLYIAAQGIAMVHGVDLPTGYWTIAVLAVVQVITLFVVGLILSPVILSSGMSMM